MTTTSLTHESDPRVDRYVALIANNRAGGWRKLKARKQRDARR
jgi:hypothetical protein